MLNIQESIAIVLIGVGATAVLDLWPVVLKRLGVPTGIVVLCAVYGLPSGHFAARALNLVRLTRKV